MKIKNKSNNNNYKIHILANNNKLLINHNNLNSQWDNQLNKNHKIKKYKNKKNYHKDHKYNKTRYCLNKN